MPNMDYSLIHRTPDGTGKILVTTPGSPDKGSWESEAELKTYVNQDTVMKTDIVQSLGQQVDKVPSNKAVDDAINAIIQHVSYSMPPNSDSGHITIENGYCDILFNTDWSDSAIWFVMRGSYGGRVVILKSSTATDIITVAFTSASTYKISNPSSAGTVVHCVSL